MSGHLNLYLAEQYVKRNILLGKSFSALSFLSYGILSPAVRADKVGGKCIFHK